MAENRFDETIPGGKFIVGDREVNANGDLLDGSAPISDLSAAQQRIADLEAQLASQADAGNPDSTDTRTNAELKAALDAKGVPYDARLNKAGLQALAVEHQA